jgi:hypothetical protein
MSVAKQVPATNLCRKMDRETMSKVANSAASEIFRAFPANTDTSSPHLVVRYPTSTLSVGAQSSSTISTEAAAIVSNLLDVTPYQRKILERGTTSITANPYKRVHGTDAVVALSSDQNAAMMLHAIGFSRVRGEGSIANPRFLKALERANGRRDVATATVEITTNVTYVTISVDAEV